MSLESVRAMAWAHGALGWALVVALSLAAWSIRRAARGVTALVAALAAGLLAVGAAATGLLLDEPYRSRLRQRLFVEAPSLGWLFERKVHLAFGATMLAVAALAALAAARSTPGTRGAALSRSAGRAAIAAAALALVASIASAIVAAHRRF